jgi:UDP-N-acetylmuramate dehydrogenase
MKIGGPARYIIEICSEQDITDAVGFAEEKELPIITIGAGSNIIFKDDGFSGVVLLNKIPGLSIDASGIVKTGAGVNWTEVVSKAVQADLSGIEAMALIPGTAGASPVNNIGAYGQEIKDSLESLVAFDTLAKQFVELSNSDCDFSYRDSRFKTKEHGRFIISQITLKLNTDANNYQPPEYPALKLELERQNITKPTPKDVEKVVTAMRQAKLPNPAWLANTGSFFKNPTVSNETADELVKSYPDIPSYPQPDGTKKLAAAWLIDKAGLKNYRQNGIWVYDRQALVLVNESANSFNDLQKMQDLITNKVKEKFGVFLEVEPEII